MTRQLVDFVVSGLDDSGGHSATLLEVAEAALVDERGRVVARFRDAGSLTKYLTACNDNLRLVAVETVGEPRADLAGRFCCYEQAAGQTLGVRKRQ